MLLALFLLLRASVTIGTDNKKLEEFGKLNNYVGNHVYLFVKKETPNIFYSPLGIYHSLAMLYSGATGNTREEIKKVLRLDKSEILDLPSIFREYLGDLKTKTDGFDIEDAFAMFVDKSVDIMPGYMRVLKTYYYSNTIHLYFLTKAETAQTKINKWIATQTKQRVKDFLENKPDPTTHVLLASAVHLRAKWQSLFYTNKMVPGHFYNYGATKRVVKCNMMQTKREMGYIESDKFKGVRLDINHDYLSMFIMVPKKRAKMEDVENFLDPEVLDVHMKHMRTQMVELTFPKLTICYKKELKDMLINLGMTSVFSEGAQLKFISDHTHSFFVNDLIHRAVFSIGESDDKGPHPKAPRSYLKKCRTLTVDRPFLFFIVDRRYYLNLFIGRVAKLE